MNRRVFLTLAGSVALCACSNTDSAPSDSVPTDGMPVSPLPGEAAEQERLGRVYKLAGFQPMGRFLPANAELVVEVDNPGPHVELVIGAPGLGSSDPRVHPLTAHRQRITDDEGGPLHIRHTGETAGEPVVVAFGPTARAIPFHRLGDPVDAWEQALAEAQDTDVVQARSDHVVLTTFAETARLHLRDDVDEVLRCYDEIVRVEDDISGEDDADPVDHRSPLLYYVSHGEPDANPDATDYRVRWPADSMGEVLSVDGLRESWGMWHELGHLHQQSAWEWEAVGEVTVNIYALAVNRHFGRPSESADGTEFATAAVFLALPDDIRDYDALASSNPPVPDADFFTMLVMFDQIRLGYGDECYLRLHRAARRRDAETENEIAAGKDYFMYAASRAAEANLIDFFTAWGLRPNDEVRAAIASLGLPPARTDLTTLRY